MEYLDFLKYFIGSVPGILLAWLQHFRASKTQKFKDYKDFMAELQIAYDQILDLKKSVIDLSVDLQQKTVKINELEKIIESLTAKAKSRQQDITNGDTQGTK